MVNDLKEVKDNLEQLSSNLNSEEVSEVKERVDECLEGADFDKKPLATVEKAMNKLNDYYWVEPVKEFLEHVKSFMESNPLSVSIQGVCEKISNSYEAQQNPEFYNPVIEKLKTLSSLSEEEIKRDVKNGAIDEHSWVPAVRNIIEKAKGGEKRSVYGQGTESLKRSHPVSPVSISEDADGNLKAVSFFLNGQPFEANLEDGLLERINAYSPEAKELGREFFDLAKISEFFDYEDGAFVSSKGSHRIKIVPDGNDGSKNKTYFDNVELDHRTLESYLRSSGIFDFDEMNEISFLEYAHNNAHKLVELDFLTTVESTRNGTRVDIVSLGDKAWVNKITSEKNYDQFEPVESAKDAAQDVKELVGYEPVDELNEMLSYEDGELAQKKQEKAKLERRRRFLTDKVYENQQLMEDYNSRKLRESDKLLKEELEKTEKRLGELYDELGVTENKPSGYVEGKLKVDLEGFDKEAGDTVKVNALEYSSNGKREEISVFLEDGSETTIQKRYLEVNL